MTGDRDDMLRRLRAVLPARWFAETAPVLTGLLTGLAQAAAASYALVAYARQQARIATASGDWLDLVARDFFAGRLSRGLGQTDASLRTAISAALFRPSATRAALVQRVTDVSGHAPLVFEPRRPADTGAWGRALAYGGARSLGAGGWGSLALPFQCLVVAYRPRGGGVSAVASYGGGPGGYGVGTIEYADSATATGAGVDHAILAAIAEVTPGCAIAWTRISP